MEKLQAALERARTQRDTAPGTPAPEQPEPPVQELWDALAPFAVKRSQLERHRVFASEAGAMATPFDILRTKVLLQMRKQGWKRLAITSPMPGAGKTTTACNLALGLSRQRDLRSILLDTDLRDPSVHKFFRAKPDHSIGDVFSGDVDFADQAVRIGENVAVSMARKQDTDPTRLLLAEKTSDIIDDIEARYAPDVMLFDQSSFLVNDESYAFLKNVDCALIVVRADATRYGDFDVCEREVAENTNVLGVVLNAYSSSPGTDRS